MSTYEKAPEISQVGNVVLALSLATTIINDQFSEIRTIRQAEIQLLEDVMGGLYLEQSHYTPVLDVDALSSTEIAVETVTESLATSGIMRWITDSAELEKSPAIIDQQGKWVRASRSRIITESRYDRVVAKMDETTNELIAGKLIRVDVSEDIDPSEVFVNNDIENAPIPDFLVGAVVSVSATLARLELQTSEPPNGNFSVYFLGDERDADSPEIKVSLSVLNTNE